IRDNNVLPFRVSYHTTTKLKDESKNKHIETEEILLAKERITHITSYILEHFSTQTKRSSTYTLNGKGLNGFMLSLLPSLSLWLCVIMKSFKLNKLA
ncbi:hypothetical protein, partial [Campylobacter vulpis]|uniref:hypothetical protein n=1 Tax=Campylobacter vulpis TaxID=1655500 RepID=UPI002079C0AC